MKKIIANAPLCFTLYSHSTQRADQHIARIEIPSCSPTRMHPVELKKITEGNLHKIYTEKSAITDALVLSTVEMKKIVYMFPSGNKLADARKELASYMDV